MNRPALASMCLVAICALMLASCDSKDQPVTPGGKRRVAVIPKGTTHEFWKSIHAGAQKAANEYNIELLWKGPLKEDDRQDQIKVVEDFINTKVNGIVLAPLDDEALVQPVETAVAQKIPVVIMDSDLKSDQYTAFVATDNFKAGQMAGEAMATAIAKKGQVLLLRYNPGSASTDNRESGFLDAIKKYPDIKVIDNKQYAGATAESAQQKSENLLASLKTGPGALSIQGIFCPNESSAFGMLRALQDGQFAGKVKFVGFDSSPKLIEALSGGQIDALVVQNPFKMGYEGMKTMALVLHGDQMGDKKVDTGAMLITKENLDKPEIKELLNPPIAEYLKE